LGPFCLSDPKFGLVYSAADYCAFFEPFTFFLLLFVSSCKARVSFLSDTKSNCFPHGPKSSRPTPPKGPLQTSPPSLTKSSSTAHIFVIHPDSLPSHRRLYFSRLWKVFSPSPSFPTNALDLAGLVFVSHFTASFFSFCFDQRSSPPLSKPCGTRAFSTTGFFFFPLVEFLHTPQRFFLPTAV